MTTWKTPGTPLDICIGNTVNVRVTEIGHVTFFVESGGAVEICAKDLLYIVQKIQEHNGGEIPLPVTYDDWALWRGTLER